MARPAATRPVSTLLRLQLADMQALEMRLHDWVQSARTEKMRHAVRWKANRDAYNNLPTPFIVNFMKNCADICHPFVQPRVDTLGDNVLQAVFLQDPPVSIQQSGPAERSRANESIVKYFMDIGQLEERCKAGLADVGTTNHGIIRLVWDPDQMCARFDNVTPDDFIVLGSACYNIETADMAGHAFYPTIGEVKDRMAQGDYYEIANYEPRPTEMDAVEDASKNTLPAPSVDNNQRPTQIYCLYFRIDLGTLKDSGRRRRGKSDVYVAHYDFQAKRVLSLRKAPSKRFPYFSFGYLPAPTRGFWSDRSVAYNLQGLHEAYQYANSMLLYGHLMTAFRPIVSKSPFSKTQNVGPGSVISSTGGEVTIPNIDFNPGQLPLVVSNLERAGDATIRIAQAGMAQASMIKKTATQAVEEAQGQAVGRTGYVSTYGIPLCEMARELLLYVAAFWQDVKSYHGDALPSAEPQVVQIPMGPAPMPDSGMFPFGDPTQMTFEVTGSSPGTNPTFMFARAMLLKDMVQVFPELKRREVIDLITASLQLRDARELVWSEADMIAMQQAQQAQQLRLVLAQAMGQAAGGGVAPGGDPMADLDMLAGQLGGANGGEQGIGPAGTDVAGGPVRPVTGGPGFAQGASGMG